MENRSRQELFSLHFLRCIALILITWDHVFPGMYLETAGEIPVTFVERYLIWPLSIINYFGFYGVVIFFLISGYAVLLAFERRPASVGGFCVKRVFRIFPPMLFSLAVYYLVYFLVYTVFDHRDLMASPLSYFAANGALWTLKVELLFYLFFAVLIPVFKRSFHTGLLILTGLFILLCEAGARWSPLRELANVGSYCFYILFGAYIYLVREHRSGGGFGKAVKLLLPLLLWYCVIHYNIVIFNPERYQTGNSYGVSFAYAALTFLVFLANEQRLPQWAAAKLVSRYSYSVYLHQIPMRVLISPFFAMGMPTLFLSAVCLICTVFFSWLYDRFLDSRVLRLQNKVLNFGGKKK